MMLICVSAAIFGLGIFLGRESKEVEMETRLSRQILSEEEEPSPTVQKPVSEIEKEEMKIPALTEKPM